MWESARFAIGRLWVQISAGAFHPPGSVNEYQLRLGMQRQVWLILIADERVGVQVKL